MKRTIQTLVLLTLAFVGIVSCISKAGNNVENKVYVEVEFSPNNIHYANVEWKKGMSALEALQYVERVETYPVGEYVFVCSIDTAINVRGENAWYYKVNGESANTLAIWNELNAGDTMTWIYKQDICSGNKNKTKSE